MSDADPYDYLPPLVESDASGHLDVGDGHRVWWEASGPADGLPVILLHGGPGAATRPAHRRFFDPAKFRYVTMHQRGCGRSTPPAAVAGNTTQALVADIETLRAQLGVDRWLVVGGSWGTALGLAYGEAHPDRCLGFVLLGVTLARPADRDWWWHGTPRLFPDAFEEHLLPLIPPDARDDPLPAVYRQVIDPDPAVHLRAARGICRFSAATTSIGGKAAAAALYDDPAVALPLARLALHYFAHDSFLAPGALLAGLHRVRHLPCAIVGGRYDVTTPLAAGWALHRAWPGSTITIVPGGAHGLVDRAIGDAFHAAVAAMYDRLAENGR